MIFSKASLFKTAVLCCYYFGKYAYEGMIKDSKYTDNKEFLPIPGAVHTDLYDNLDVIPFEKLKAFFTEYLK